MNRANELEESREKRVQERAGREAGPEPGGIKEDVYEGREASSMEAR